jgi:hypothetical protein
MGRSAEISRDELKFFKFIERLRLKFSEIFLQAMRVQLVLRGIMKEEEWDKIHDEVRFEFARDSYFTELKNSEILNERMSLLREMNDHVGKYYSIDWIRKHILHQTEEEIEEMDKEIQNEREKGLIKTGTEDYY